MKATKIILASSVLALMAGCGGSGDSKTQRTVERPTTSAISELKQTYKYQLVFVDATGTTLEPIDDELTVTFAGTATDVVDSTGASLAGKTVAVTDGMLSIAANLSDSNYFTVVAGNRSKGWQETGIQLSKTNSKAGSQTVLVKLLNTGDAATINANTNLGLAMVTETANLGAGYTKSTTAKTVNNESIGTATISIPAGTKVYDENGAELSANGVNVSIVKFGNNESRALSAFPGGFAPTVVDSTGASRNDGAFITGGFAQFNLTAANGTPIKKFSDNIELSIDLPKDSKNPATGAALAVGDTYPVWSFDETTGNWKFEANGTISAKANGDWTVTFTTNHLSYWNLDYYYNTCTATLNLNRTAQDNRPLNFEIIGENGLRFFRSYSAVRDSSQTIFNYPRNTKVNVKVMSGNTVVGETTAPVDLCAGASVPVAAPSNVVSGITVNVTESCPSGSNKRPVPAYIDLVRSDWSDWLFEYGTSGNFTGLEQGSQYNLWVYNTRNWSFQSQVITVGATSQTIDINYPNLQCESVVITGATGASN